METTGYNRNNPTFLSRIVAFKNKHWKHIAYALLIIVLVLSIIVESSDKFKEWLSVNELIFIYLYLILMVAVDISITINSNKNNSIEIKEKQDKSIPVLIDYVQKCKSSETCDLLEYAGQTSLPLIREINDKGNRIRILIQHPDNLTGNQKLLSITNLNTLYNTIFYDSTKFEIRCYRQPYTLKGRKIGNKILELGWLTPNIKNQTAFGHGNPSILIDLSVRKNDCFLVFFEKTFNDLWNDSQTEDGKTVLNNNITTT